MQILGLVGCKSLTLAVYCFSSWFVHQELKTYSALFVLCRLCHLAWFQGIKYIQPSFRPQVTNHDVKSKTLNKLFLRSSLFYTTFSWCWKIEEKSKNICEGQIKSKAKQMFYSPVLKAWQHFSFTVESLAVWRISRNQFEPVWTEIAKKNTLHRN